MLEHLVGKSGGKRDDFGIRAGFDLDGNEVQGIDIVEAVGLGARRANTLTLAAQSFEHVQHRRPEATLREVARDGSGSRRIG